MSSRAAKRTRLLVTLMMAIIGSAHASSQCATARGRDKPLRVFILAGQSNMQGHAHVRTLDALALDPGTADLLRELRAKDGTPRVHADVWISSLSSAGEKQGRLSSGFGADGEKLGPELTFGITAQKLLDEPILLIKTAWGGKSLHTDFRPPGAGPYEFSAAQRRRFAQQGKDFAKIQADKEQATGHYYRLMTEHVKKVLANIKQVYPAYSKKRGYELAGFVWFQGWNDMVDRDTYPQRDKPGGYDLYSRLMTQFIRDVRKDLAAPKLPFVIGVLGVGGPVAQYTNEQRRHKATHQNFRDAMAAPARRAEFRGNVFAVRTEQFWDSELSALKTRDERIQQRVKKLRLDEKLDRKAAQAELEKRRAEAFTAEERALLRKGVSNQAYHYLGSAKIMARIGRGFAEALLARGRPTRGPAPAFSKQNPDFTRGGTIPKGATHDWNLGPTGARGWMYGHKLETTEARQIAITKVEVRSPAARVLRPGDVILGVADEPFAYDPRTELGRAISAAEATDGKLALIRWRKGKTAKAVVRLSKLGAYSASAPFDCPKSKRIFERGCEALARRMKADPDAGNPIVRSLNALALLASGKRKYLPLVRQQVAWASKYSDPDRSTYHSWFYGPVNLLLAEYALATGDRRFLSDLKRVTLEIVRGQSAVGSWGHRFVQANGRLAGYGMMNAPGLPLTLSLVLARKAGVDDPALDEAIDKSARLIRFYVGKGSVPYGDHHPWIETHDDNGKNGVAALLFNELGDTEAAAYFSRMSVASHGAERDSGHTGNFFNLLWAMPAVALSGPYATGAWMQEFGWYYDLARRWDGTYLHQGPPDVKPDKYRGWDCTGAYLLAYAQALRKLHITGKQPGFVVPLGAAAAERLVEDGRGWSSRRKLAAYAQRSEAEILAGLKSWSPVVRERSATELARRSGDPTPRLIEMLTERELHGRIGACQALTQLGKRAAPAVSALRETLGADDLWLRIKAAEALASIGKEAMATVPDLLAMLARTDPESDPRGMQQRYLSFALFNRRGGMLGRSLAGVDREALYAAVRAGLANEDGRARGSFESVYRNLSYEEIEPLLPAIYRAVREPAPSGIMFADGIRMSGLEILAKQRIAEGLPLCVELIEPERWGLKNRIQRCLASLRRYGGAARSLIPQLRQLQDALAKKSWKPDAIRALKIGALIRDIESDARPPTLRALPRGR